MNCKKSASDSSYDFQTENPEIICGLNQFASDLDSEFPNIEFLLSLFQAITSEASSQFITDLWDILTLNILNSKKILQHKAVIEALISTCNSSIVENSSYTYCFLMGLYKYMTADEYSHEIAISIFAQLPLTIISYLLSDPAEMTMIENRENIQIELNQACLTVISGIFSFYSTQIIEYFDDFFAPLLSGIYDMYKAVWAPCIFGISNAASVYPDISIPKILSSEGLIARLVDLLKITSNDDVSVKYMSIRLIAAIAKNADISTVNQLLELGVICSLSLDDADISLWKETLSLITAISRFDCYVDAIATAPITNQLLESNEDYGLKEAICLLFISLSRSPSIVHVVLAHPNILELLISIMGSVDFTIAKGIHDSIMQLLVYGDASSISFDKALNELQTIERLNEFDDEFEGMCMPLIQRLSSNLQ